MDFLLSEPETSAPSLGSVNGLSYTMDIVAAVNSESRSVVSSPLRPHGLYSPWNSPEQNTRVGSFSLLQGIFPTQGWNPGLQHCRWILYQLSHERSPRTLEWVVFPFSRGSSQPRKWISLLHCRQILYQLSYQGSPYCVHKFVEKKWICLHTCSWMRIKCFVAPKKKV